MIMNINKKRHKVISIIICIIFAILCTCFLLNTTVLEKKLYAQAESYLMDVNEQMADNISYRLNTDLQFIKGLANSVSKMGLKEVKKEWLNEKEKEFALDELGILYPDGRVFPRGFSPFYLEKYREKSEKIWEKPIISYANNHNIFFSAPIMSKGENTDHVMVGIKNYSSVQELMDKANYQNTSINILIDTDGTTIAVSTSEKVLQLMNTDAIEQDILSKLIQEVKKGDKKAKEAFIIDIDPIGKMMVSFYKLEVNNWLQISAMPLELVQKRYQTHLMIYFWLVLISVVTSIIIIRYIITLQQEVQKKLEKLAFDDPLTKGMNNNAFKIQCQELLKKAEWSSYGMIYLDIVDFKNINENWGMEEGNKVLKYIFDTFRQDIEEDELITRSEIDHFFVLLKGDTEQELSQKITAVIEKINRFDDVDREHYRLEFAIGGYVITPECKNVQTIQDWTRRAAKFCDIYNVCKFYNKEIIDTINRQNKLNALFEESIKNHHFEVYLQPKVYLKEKAKPCAAEALVRWIHPEEGIIYPSDFIPLFEENGKICELDLYVFEEVCKMIARWKAENRPIAEISVNLSRMHMKNINNDLLQKYYELKQKYGVPDGVIELELTETSVLYEQQFSYVAEIIRQFQDAGFLCALDDFGFGYSSLSLLKEFNVNTIKLDRSFFVNESKKSKIVVESIIHLAHAMNIQIVAEGIEEENQVETLYELGCDLIQGYYYSKPLPINEFEQWQDWQTDNN